MDDLDDEIDEIVEVHQTKIVNPIAQANSWKPVSDEIPEGGGDQD